MINEFLQDMKALGGLPIYVIIIALFLTMGDFIISTALTIGLVISYAVTIGIRSVYFKERPKKVKYRTKLEKLDASSFPSMHTIRVVVLGIILATAISTPLFSILAIPCIILAAYARVKLKRHHLIDVAAGAVFGILIALVSIWITNLIF